jgi:hypothetical protein
VAELSFHMVCGCCWGGGQVTCFAEAGGQHVPGMARAVQRLGIRACLARSTMDSGEGLPQLWAAETTDSCLQVRDLSWLFHVCNIPRSLLGLHFVCQSVRILVKD